MLVRYVISFWKHAACIRSVLLEAGDRNGCPTTLRHTHRGLHKGMDGSTDFTIVVSVDAESVVRCIVNE